MRYIFTLLFVLGFLNTDAGIRRYVNINATGSNNGTSWANAFTNLALAIDTYPGDSFWVANGTYTSNVGEPWAFHVLDSTVLLGGFNGTETSLEQRNFSSHATVIAGTNNYSSIIRVESGNKSAVIDGFKISHTLGFGQQTQNWGVLIYGRCLLTNCLISNVWNPMPVFVSTTYPVSISNCIFDYNGHPVTSPLYAKGAALTVGGTDVTVTDCVFKNNESNKGGAVYLNSGSQSIFNRCVFYGNKARTLGGAIFDSSSGPFRVLNSLFAGNKAMSGAAHYGTDSLNRKRAFINCTFAHNLASQPGADNYTLFLNGTRDTLLNCILWGDSSGTGPEIPNQKSSSYFNRNLIEKGTSILGATGTIITDPLFVSPGTAAAAPFASTTNFNYHVKALSDAIDSGAGLPAHVLYSKDLDTNVRTMGFATDLGAYEWKTCNWVNAIITPSGPTNFCIPDSVRLTASANPLYNHVYQWNGGTFTGPSITVKTSGYYKVVVVDSTGCRSAAGMMVNAVATPTPVITRTVNTLSVPAIYGTYQWYYGGVIISGATNPTYNLSKTGSYTVKVTTSVAACPGTSAAFTVSTLSVANAAASANLDVFPNPASGRLNIRLDAPGGTDKIQLTLRSLTGQTVWSNEFRMQKAEFEHSIDVSKLAAGVYFLSVDADGFQWVRKVSITE
jgi:hypothetical protein